MAKIMGIIKNRAFYLVGGIVGLFLGVACFYIWKALIWETFRSYLITLTTIETIFSCFALIGIATSLTLVTMLLLKLKRWL